MMKKLMPTSLFGFMNEFDSKEKSKKRVKLNLTAIFFMTFFMLSPDLLESSFPVYILFKPIAVFLFLLISMSVSAFVIQILFKQKTSFTYAMKYTSTVKMLLMLSSIPYVIGMSSTGNPDSIYFPIVAFPILIAMFIYASSVFTANRVSAVETGDEEYGFSANMNDFDEEPAVASKKKVLMAMAGHAFKVVFILFMMMAILTAIA